jgi:caa(3)-type oxidase subunit IV
VSSETHIHHPDYVKIWAVLVALLVVSVLGSMTSIRWLVLITAFGVAVIKAYLVAKNFMHVTIEKRFIPYLLVTCLVLMILLFAGVAPDVMKHAGLHWENSAAKQAVESGSRNAAPKHD